MFTSGQNRSGTDCLGLWDEIPHVQIQWGKERGKGGRNMSQLMPRVQLMKKGQKPIVKGSRLAADWLAKHATPPRSEEELRWGMGGRTSSQLMPQVQLEKKDKGPIRFGADLRVLSQRVRDGIEVETRVNRHHNGRSSDPIIQTAESHPVDGMMFRSCFFSDCCGSWTDGGQEKQASERKASVVMLVTQFSFWLMHGDVNMSKS